MQDAIRLRAYEVVCLRQLREDGKVQPGQGDEPGGVSEELFDDQAIVPVETGSMIDLPSAGRRPHIEELDGELDRPG